jgi:cytochrome bd-type quinol oxidase subunit 2
MTEIKKFTKIVLIVYIIIFLLMGTLLTFLFDLTMNPEGWTDPFYPGFFGGVIYVCAIFSFLMLRKKEWEEIKFTFEFFLGIFISTLTIQIVIWPIFAPTFGAAITQLATSTTILMSIILLLGIICYLKQRS